MKRLSLILIFIALFWQVNFAQTPATDPHWELYMTEEFDENNLEDLYQRWNSPVFGGMSRQGLSFLYTTQDDYNYSPYLYLCAAHTSFSDHRNYLLESGDGDGQLSILPKFESTPFRKDLLDWIKVPCDPLTNPNCDPNNPYTYQAEIREAYFTMTTGSIASKEQLMNGYFETRMKLPYIDPNTSSQSYYGTYPTFWLYSEYKDANGSKINQSEIDIYEIINGKDPITTSNDRILTNSSLVTQNVHCWDESLGGNPKDNYSDERANDVDAPDKIINPITHNEELHYQKIHGMDKLIDYSGAGWHTISVEWNPEYVIFYVDGQQTRKVIRNVNLLSPMGVIMTIDMPAAPLIKAHGEKDELTGLYPGPLEIPYPSTSSALNNPNGLRILPSNLDGSTATGNFGSGAGGGIYNNNLGNMPQNFKYEIDYVKIYKLKTNCNQDVVFSGSNYSGYTEDVKKSIVFNNTNEINAGNNLQLRAQESVLITGDFTVNTGAQFSATAHGCPVTPSKYVCNLTPYINCNFSPNSYDNNIKSYVEITGQGGCQSTINPGEFSTIRAKDYIDIKEMDSKLNSDLTIKIEDCQ